MLKINNITKTFGAKIILNNISLTVKPGEIAVLLGPSGVGKSTLLRVLNNLETYTQGSILLDGHMINPEQAIAKHPVGMVFQQFNLFENMTVERNITFPLERVALKTPEEAHVIAHALLKKYALLDKAHVLVTRLSGGQKQRLAIARTLALKPKVICLDEPTSALDPLLTSSVAKNIQELALEGYIVVVATHDTMLIEKLSCTIYLMDHGTIVQSADFKEFLKNKDTYPLIKSFVEGTEKL